MQRLSALLLCTALFFSCKQEKKDTAFDNGSAFEIVTIDWPQKYTINPEAQAIMNDWMEYMALDASFDALYTVENREDLSLVVEELIEKQKDLEKSIYPEAFDKPQIKSRQKMVKTFILKVKGDLFYRLDPHKSVLDLIAAYNAFRNQFNIIMNNSLPADLILDE